MFNIEMLRSKSETDLALILKEFGIKVAKSTTENDKIFAILDFQASNPKIAKDYYLTTTPPEPAAESAQAVKPAAKPVAKKPAAKPAAAKPVKKAAPVVKKTTSISDAPSQDLSIAELEAPAEITQPAEPAASATPKQAERPAQASKNRRKPTESIPEQNADSSEQPEDDSNDRQKNAPRAAAQNQDKPTEKKPQGPSQAGQRKPQHQNNAQKPANSNQNSNQNSNSNRAPQEPLESKKEFNFDGLVTIEGVLEILPDNYGFLRSSDFSYISSPDDVYVSTAQIRNYGLKTGDTVKGIVRLPKEGEKYFSLKKPLEVNGRDLDFIKDRVAFEYLTPLFPEEKFNLAGKGSTISTRIVDMFAPIGKGQRAMIVAQPKTGKTMILKEIANAISANHPEAYMMVLLIDERPEEVTDMERSVNAEVIASTFDEAADKHVKVANLVLAKAQRLVECGHDVVILLDSITRLARAYNTVTPASGKVLSGGVDANALHKPKRFFGAARNIEGGGSLTIIATALIDTGSKMDEVIFEEFKGTGNMELQLDRKIANKRIYPAIDLVSSSTRKDDLLLGEGTMQRMWILRKFLSDMNPLEAMDFVEKNIKGTVSNEEFLMSMNR